MALRTDVCKQQPHPISSSHERLSSGFQQYSSLSVPNFSIRELIVEAQRHTVAFYHGCIIWSYYIKENINFFSTAKEYYPPFTSENEQGGNIGLIGLICLKIGISNISTGCRNVASAELRSRLRNAFTSAAPLILHMINDIFEQRWMTLFRPLYVAAINTNICRIYPEAIFTWSCCQKKTRQFRCVMLASSSTLAQRLRRILQKSLHDHSNWKMPLLLRRWLV